MPRQRSLLNTSGLRAMHRLMNHVSDHMAGASPDEVLNNFVEMLKKAHPALRIAITFYTPWIMIAMALSKYTLLMRACSTVWQYVVDSLTSKVTIPSTHPLQKQVMAWMVQHGLKDARTLALTPPHSKTKSHAQLELDSIYSRHSKTKVQQEEKETEQLLYVPDVGTYDFTYKGYKMTFQKRIKEKKEYDRANYQFEDKEIDTIIISCRSPFAGAKPIQAFLEHVKMTAAEAEDSMTKIFRATTAAGYHAWDAGRSRPSRKLNAVTLDASIKEPLVKDVEDYLNPKTKRFYVSNGIPYRKGYLLYGPPGTGKTSFATALAGEYGLNVYLLSLSDTLMDDKSLESLFEQLPTKCIVLMEDIDSAGIKREKMKGEEKPKKKKKSSVKHRLQRQLQMQRQIQMDSMTPAITKLNGLFGDDDDLTDSEAEADRQEQPSSVRTFSKPGVTLSGLLNVLDGVNAAEGRIVLMTSNDPDSLDKALVRAGRIDRKILFGYASHEVAAKLFTKVFTKSADQLLEGEVPFENVPALAEEFAAAIPAGAITPAEIQSHLLHHRADPVACVEAAPEFAKQTMEEKKNGKNVAAFNNELKPGRSGTIGQDHHMPVPLSGAPADLSAMIGAAMRGLNQSTQDPAAASSPYGGAAAAFKGMFGATDVAQLQQSTLAKVARHASALASAEATAAAAAGICSNPVRQPKQPPTSNAAIAGFKRSTTAGSNGSDMAQAINRQLASSSTPAFNLLTPVSSSESMLKAKVESVKEDERRDSPVEGSEASFSMSLDGSEES